MPIQHHVDDATLMSFAAGSLPEALAAVVAAHIDVCPRCAREVRRMEAIGTALFSGLRTRAMQQPANLMAVRRAEADVAEPHWDAAPSTDVPAALAHLIGRSLDGVAWKTLAPGVQHYRLPTRTGDLRLLKVSPGRRMPEHGHGGSEITLMLRGSYSDETGTYFAGDVADLDDGVVHRPVADPFDGCICLIASERPARFKGLLPRMVQPLTGM
jgi:putative transcriptional regulator